MLLLVLALFCSLSYSYAISIPHTNPISNAGLVPSPMNFSIEDDNTNWKDVLKQLKSDVGRSGTDPNNLTIFDLIIKANAEARGNGIARSDSNLFLYQGDIAMNKSLAIQITGQYSQGTTRRKRAVMRKSTRNLWKNNIKYRLASNLNRRARTVIRSAIREWERTLPCKGKWTEVRSNIGDNMYFFSGGGCYSRVGRQGGSQRVSIGRGCEYHGIAVHEIGHAMGFWHEQSRPDRDRYVRIHYNNIIPAMRFNFQKYSTARVNSLGIPYDYGSVMHYGKSAFAIRRGLTTISSRKGRQQLGQRKGLSRYDIKQAQLLYGCTKTAPTKRPRPSRCTDKNKFCISWRNKGYCKNRSYSTYMQSNCCRACSQTGCTDKNMNCIYWRNKGYCKNRLYSPFMQRNCCRACS